MNYIGIALVCFTGSKTEMPCLYTYPAFTSIRVGDLVKVDDGRIGTVVWNDETHTDREDFQGIVIASGAELPLKRIRAYARWTEFAWEDETDERIDPVGTADS